MPAVQCVAIGVVKPVIRQHSITSRCPLAHVRSWCVGVAGVTITFQTAKEAALIFCPTPVGMWDHLSTSQLVSQEAGAVARAGGPVPALTPNSPRISPRPPSFPSHRHDRRAQTRTHTLSLIPIPQTHPGSDPGETQDPQRPGRENPASPRLRPQRGPSFRRTARKPLVRFPSD